MKQVFAILIIAIGLYPVIIPLVWLFIRKISENQSSYDAKTYYSKVLKNVR